ncbi:MAG: chalcone isomerase family protein, partial [Pseudomonadota bacterium]|nr:chalcone isomerase family protein [Pseudomonadota bacterium]
GPRRIALIMLREVSSADFTEAFMHGLNANSDNNEKARLAGQTVKFGNLFVDTPNLKKGDVITVDWLPAVGTQVQLNGKSLSEPLPDAAFYNALLKIWLGDNPVDSHLKPQLLGSKA